MDLHAWELESEGLSGKSGQPDLVSAFTEYVDEVRMKRLHALALFAYLAACIAWLCVCEAWRWGRKQHRG